MFFELKRIFKKLLPPSDCYLCHAPVPPTTNQSPIICQHCHQRLILLKTSCPVCAIPQATSIHFACGECLKLTPPFRKTVSAFHYEPPVSDFITSLKFNHQRQFLSLLTDYLLAQIKLSYQTEPLPEQLLAVPLHQHKIRQRGFNQAQLITQYLSQRLNINNLKNTVIRQRNTLPQTSLNATERQNNLKNAFRVKQLTAKHIAIVDDVMTTGTTVSELAQCLINAGAIKVDVWCLARAYPT